MKARHEFETDQAYQEYLRTYFAAMAMQGILANNIRYGDFNEAAKQSVLYTDALINALNQ